MAITRLQILSLDDNPEADYAAEIYLRGNARPVTLVSRIQIMPGVVSALDIEK